MNIYFERNWIWFGLLLGIIPILGLSKNNPLDLQVLSIFFGALLAIAAIIQSSWDTKTLRRLRLTGHDKYLIEYIIVPSYLCFILIILAVGRELIFLPPSVNFYDLIKLAYLSISDALLGVFLLSMVRILMLVAPIIRQENN